MSASELDDGYGIPKDANILEMEIKEVMYHVVKRKNLNNILSKSEIHYACRVIIHISKEDLEK